MVPTTSKDGPEDISEDLFTTKSLAKKKAPAKTRETKKGGLGGKPPARHSTSEVPKSSEDDAPDLPSVRVLRTKRWKLRWMNWKRMKRKMSWSI